MSDKLHSEQPAAPTTPAGVLQALPDYRVLALAGRDACAFAQAQCMNDVAALPPGHWQWNGWLTPKGRVVALFALLKLDAETVWLLLPDADPAELAAQLQRFVFRSKVALSVRDDLLVSGSFAAPGKAAGAAFAGAADSGLELDFGGDGGARRLRIETRSDTVPGAVSDNQWRGFDLRHGLPRLDSSQVERWTPQQLSLERLRAYSVKKGCYPGQEIVARTHFLGQAKRGLMLLATDAPLASGSEVRAGEKAIGTLVSNSDRLALAVMPLNPPDGPLSVDGKALQPEPLLDGLAR